MKWENGNTNILPKDADPELYEIIGLLANAELTSDPNQAVQVRVYVPWHESSRKYIPDETVFLKLSDGDVERIIELYKNLEDSLFFQDVVPEEYIIN